MKKIVLVIIILLLITTGCSLSKESVKKKTQTIIEKVSLLEMDDYKDIVLDKIKSINYIRYTEGGREDNEIIDKDEITTIYNYLKNIKVGEETNRACEDNTTIYELHLNDDRDIKIEIECDWLVIGNKRYLIK